MDSLNYHHLRYFREVAIEGNLTKAAERLNLSQSALSAQIKQLEARLGHALFDRVGRKLLLTEVGRIALDHADRIFGAGEELLATLSRAERALPPLQVGALSTLSRNFQLQFLRPVLNDPDQALSLQSGSARVLFEGLRTLALDVVLTTEPPAAESGFLVRPIDAQAVGLHGAPKRVAYQSLAELLAAEPIIIPRESTILVAFQRLAAQLNVQPRIIAEVDDMAMIRLLAREGVGIAAAPSVVLADELASGDLVTAPFELNIVESFYAVTIQRSFPHPALERLLAS